MPESIEWRTRPPRRRRFFVVLALAAIIIFGSRTVDALWLGSLGYGDVFRKTLSLQWAVFATFFAGTFFILYGWFLALRRTYQPELLSGGIIFISGRPLRLPVDRILRLIVLVISLVIAAATGASMMAEWPRSRSIGMHRATLATLWIPSSACRCTSIYSLFPAIAVVKRITSRSSAVMKINSNCRKRPRKAE